jgi:hypothetical protein
MLLSTHIDSQQPYIRASSVLSTTCLRSGHTCFTKLSAYIPQTYILKISAMSDTHTTTTTFGTAGSRTFLQGVANLVLEHTTPLQDEVHVLVAKCNDKHDELQALDYESAALNNRFQKLASVLTIDGNPEDSMQLPKLQSESHAINVKRQITRQDLRDLEIKKFDAYCKFDAVVETLRNHLTEQHNALDNVLQPVTAVVLPNENGQDLYCCEDLAATYMPWLQSYHTASVCLGTENWGNRKDCRVILQRLDSEYHLVVYNDETIVSRVPLRDIDDQIKVRESDKEAWGLFITPEDGPGSKTLMLKVGTDQCLPPGDWRTLAYKILPAILNSWPGADNCEYCKDRQDKEDFRKFKARHSEDFPAEDSADEDY